MDTPYITVTLEISGYDEDVLTELHENLRDVVKAWRPRLTYAELTIAYQDQDQIEDDATVTNEQEDAWTD